MTSFTFFEVGKPSPVSRGYGFQGNVFQYDATGYHLMIFLRGITPKEIEELRREAVYHFSLVMLGSVVFVMSRIVLPPKPAVGRFCERTIVEGDAPYSWHLVHPSIRPSLAEVDALSVPSKKRAVFSVKIIDSLTNLVHAIRWVTPSTAFTAALHAAVARQAREPYLAADYDRQVEAIYRKYTTKQLFGRSSYRCVGGENEITDTHSVADREENRASSREDCSDYGTALGGGGVPEGYPA